MKERGILFSAPMVRALLDGSKTQTRRLVKPQPRRGLMGDGSFCPNHSDQISGEYHVWESGKRGTIPLTDGCAYRWQELCPYGVPGDRLWVRETWRPEERSVDAVAGIRFRANEAFITIANTQDAATAWVVAANNRHDGKWRPAIHMPRWASRITLEVTDVRVQRVQEISDSDALAEGALSYDPNAALMRADELKEGDARYLFRTLWDRINGKTAPWDSNPWVWAITFKRVEP